MLKFLVRDLMITVTIECNIFRKCLKSVPSIVNR